MNNMNWVIVFMPLPVLSSALSHKPMFFCCTNIHTGAFVAGIYMTLGWSMSSAAALGWGAGLSAISLTLTTLTSLVPIYAVL